MKAKISKNGDYATIMKMYRVEGEETKYEEKDDFSFVMCIHGCSNGIRMWCRDN